MARIAAHPLPAGRGRALGPGEAFIGVVAPLYDTSQWPTLAMALAAAERGDGSPLMAQNDTYLGRSSDGTYTNEEVSNSAVNCLDHPRPTVAGLEALAATARRRAPYFGGAIAWGDVTCAYWPVAPDGLAQGPIRAPGTPAVLVVGSTDDTVTPYADAQGLARELGHAVLVTRHGAGHTGYPFSTCVRTVVDNYLVSLTVPDAAAADCPT
jgi:pimeloyl-ACP methyl ester carboxylesterase